MLPIVSAMRLSRRLKPFDSIYLADVKKPAWIKIKNPAYSQKEGRQELFER